MVEPRQFTNAFADATEANETAENFPLFVRITHPDLAEPIRIVQDGNGVSYQWNGELYVGMPFDFEFLSDNDQAPVGSCGIANVSKEIGEKIRKANPAFTPQVSVYALSRFDFSANLDLSIGPDGALTELVGGADIQMKAEMLSLSRVVVDNVRIAGTIASFDFTAEPFNRRATPGRCPALFYST